MRTIYLLALISLLPLAGCRKAEEGPTSASGYVRDQVSGQPVPGAQVRLLRSGGGNNILTGGGTLPLDTISADAAGHYALSFSATEGYTYEMQGFAPGYLTGWLDAQPLVRVKGGRKNKQDVPLRPEGYLRVRFLAPNPVLYSGVSLDPFRGLPVKVFSGVNGSPNIPIDSMVTITYPGGQDGLLSWRLYPDGTSASSYQSATVYFPAHDTADFTIRF